VRLVSGCSMTHGVEARAAKAGAGQQARDGTGGQPVGLGVWVRLVGHGRWQLGRPGLAQVKRSRPIWAVAGVFVGFWPMAT
jgi:hypothetical protein